MNTTLTPSRIHSFVVEIYHCLITSTINFDNINMVNLSHNSHCSLVVAPKSIFTILMPTLWGSVYTADT